MFPFLLVLGWICLAVSWSDRLKRIFETLNNLVLVLHYRTIDSSRKPVVWCGCTVTVAERTKWPPVAALVRLVCLVVRCCIAAQSQLIKRLRIDNSSAYIPLNSYLEQWPGKRWSSTFIVFRIQQLLLISVEIQRPRLFLLLPWNFSYLVVTFLKRRWTARCEFGIQELFLYRRAMKCSHFSSKSFRAM